MPHIAYIVAAGGGGGPCLSVLTFFFGERLGGAGAPSGDPLTEREAFDSYLTGTVDTEDFEGQSTGTSLASITSTWANSSGTITGTWAEDFNGGFYIADGFGINVPSLAIYNTDQNGRYNTTTSGAKYAEHLLPLECSFDVYVSAFGFYLTDVGDFGDNDLSIELTDENDVVTSHLVGNTAPTSGDALLFWGFIDPTGLTYKKVKVVPVGLVDELDPDYTTFIDGIGIDDVRAAVTAQVSVC